MGRLGPGLLKKVKNKIVDKNWAIKLDKQQKAMLSLKAKKGHGAEIPAR
jgi:hypothetical protein